MSTSSTGGSKIAYMFSGCDLGRDISLIRTIVENLYSHTGVSAPDSSVGAFFFLPNIQATTIPSS